MTRDACVPHAHLAFDVGGEEERCDDAGQAERRAVAHELREVAV